MTTKTQFATMAKGELAALIALATKQSKTSLMKLSKDALVTMAGDIDEQPAPEQLTEPEGAAPDAEKPTVEVKSATGQGKSRKWTTESYIRRHQRDPYDDETIKQIVAKVVLPEGPEAIEQAKAVWGDVVGA